MQFTKMMDAWMRGGVEEERIRGSFDDSLTKVGALEEKEETRRVPKDEGGRRRRGSEPSESKDMEQRTRKSDIGTRRKRAAHHGRHLDKAPVEHRQGEWH